MKVFISWSRGSGKKVAKILKEWLDTVITGIDVFVSCSDIEKGTRWNTEIEQNLEESNFGIIILTKESMNSPWLFFEAGAISKHIKSAKVAPFLYDITNEELHVSNSPLARFQTTTYLSEVENTEERKEEVLQLVTSINNSLDKKIEASKLKKQFDMWFSILEEKFIELKSSETIKEMLQESHGTQKLIVNSIEDLKDYVKSISNKINLKSIDEINEESFINKEKEIIKKNAKNQGKIFSKFHDFIHRIRKFYFVIELEGELSPDSLERDVLRAYMKGGQIAVDILEEILTEITGEQIYSCVKLIWSEDETRSPNPIIYVPETTKCITLCRSVIGSRRSERTQKDMQDNNPSKFRLETVSNHLIFDELMRYFTKSYVFYNDVYKECSGNLKEISLIEGAKGKYNTTISVPIRGRVAHRGGKPPPLQDIFGFLCVDTLKEGTFNLNEDNGNTYASLMRAFADVLYIYFEKCRRLSANVGQTFLVDMEKESNTNLYTKI